MPKTHLIDGTFGNMVDIVTVTVVADIFAGNSVLQYNLFLWLAERYYQDYLVLKGEAELIGKFEKEYGMKIVYPDVEAFRKNAGSAYKDFESEWGKGMYEKIQGIR